MTQQSDLSRAIQTVRAAQGTAKRLRGNKRWSFNLTPLGKIKVDQHAVSGLNWDVMSHLDDFAPCTQREISESLHISSTQVHEVLTKLVDSYGYVSRIPQSA